MNSFKYIAGNTLLIFFLSAAILYPQEINDDVNSIIGAQYSQDTKIILSKYVLPKELKQRIENNVQQKFHSTFVYFYKIIKDDKILGYAILDNVFGKSLPITFLVLFDLNGNIISSHIVKYREQYGGAVKNKNWNDQFIGGNSESSFEVGKNINSISGATISVNSVTKGIKKLTLLIKEIIDIEN